MAARANSRELFAVPRSAHRLRIGYSFSCHHQSCPGRDAWMSSPANLMGQKRPGCPIDLFIGSRLRIARKSAHLSQERLAQDIGVKFQQIQKYEKGVSRISAGRLHKIAVALNLPLSFFLPEVDAEGGSSSAARLDEISAAVEFLRSSEALELGLTLSQIKDIHVRRRVIGLVRAIAEGTK